MDYTLIICCFIAALFLALYAANSFKSNQRIKSLTDIIQDLHAKNKDLRYEVEFQKQINKTFSDGLEALTNKKK